MMEHLKEYKEKLEHSIEAYMNMPISQRSAYAIREMIECWEHVNKMIEACEMQMEE